MLQAETGGKSRVTLKRPMECDFVRPRPMSFNVICLNDCSFGEGDRTRVGIARVGLHGSGNLGMVPLHVVAEDHRLVHHVDLGEAANRAAAEVHTEVYIYKLLARPKPPISGSAAEEKPSKRCLPLRRLVSTYSIAHHNPPTRRCMQSVCSSSRKSKKLRRLSLPRSISCEARCV